MWYIPMCIGLYAALPIVKQIVSDKRIAYYYLLLSFVFAFIIPSAMALAKDFGPQWMNSLVRVANDVITDMHMQLVLGYSAYFVLGYVLSEPDSVKGKSIDRCIYVLGILGFLLTILVTLFASHRKAEAVTTYYDFLTVNVLLESVAVFTAFRRMDFKNERLNKSKYKKKYGNIDNIKFRKAPSSERIKTKFNAHNRIKNGFNFFKVTNNFFNRNSIF